MVSFQLPQNQDYRFAVIEDSTGSESTDRLWQCLKHQPASCSPFHLPPSAFCTDGNKVYVHVLQPPRAAPQICAEGCALQWTNELERVNTCVSWRAAPDLQCFQTRSDHAAYHHAKGQFWEQRGVFPAASMLRLPPAWDLCHWQLTAVVLCSSRPSRCFVCLTNDPDYIEVSCLTASFLMVLISSSHQRLTFLMLVTSWKMVGYFGSLGDKVDLTSSNSLPQ